MLVNGPLLSEELSEKMARCIYIKSTNLVGDNNITLLEINTTKCVELQHKWKFENDFPGVYMSIIYGIYLWLHEYKIEECNYSSMSQFEGSFR